MEPKQQDWKVGDAVYGLRYVRETNRWRVHGEGRIVQIEGGVLHLATTKGPTTMPAHAWPAFKSREEGEAYCREHPGPQHDSRPMAHYGADTSPARPEPQWECLRCEQLRDGREPIVPDHSPRCSYRGTGRDPEREG